MGAAWIVLVVALWLTVVLLAVLVSGLIRRVGQLERALSTPGRLTPSSSPASARLAPGRPLPVVAGYEWLTTAAEASRGRLILFLGSTCTACRRLGEELRAARGDAESSGRQPEGPEVIVVTDPDGEGLFAELGASAVAVEPDGELSAAWDVPGTPFAVAVDERGLILDAALVRTLPQVRELAGTLAIEAGLR